MASQHNKSPAKKPKLVRDSFTIPKAEFAAIETLKTRAIGLGTSVKKSELIRAGLMALQGLGDAAYKAALAAVPTLKTGRPSADKPAAAPAVAPKAAAKKKLAAKPAVRPATARKAAPAKAAAKTPAKPTRKPVGKTA